MIATPHLLTNLDDLDRAIAASATRPVLLFKHSPTCGTSAQAEEEILDLLAGPQKVDAGVYVVGVRASRTVSDAITTRFKLRHESPQVLLINDGILVWSASHFRVTSGGILAALARLAAPSPA
jgi:bacillithiol system protein YtxJ